MPFKILFFACFVFAPTFAFGVTNQSSPLIRIYLDHVDLRGEHEGRVSQFALLPILCRERIQIQYYKGAKEFIEKNNISAFGGPGEVKENQRTATNPNCINGFDSKGERGYGGHTAASGVDNYLNRPFYDISRDPNRPEALFVWIDMEVMPVIEVIAKGAGLNNTDEVSSFEWVTLNPRQEPYIKETSVLYPTQNISFKVEFANEHLPFAESLKLELTRLYP
jgi:hypothetical protein